MNGFRLSFAAVLCLLLSGCHLLNPDPQRVLDRAFSFFDAADEVQGDEAWLIGMAAVITGRPFHRDVANSLQPALPMAAISARLFDSRFDSRWTPEPASRWMQQPWVPQASPVADYDIEVSPEDGEYVLAMMTLALTCSERSFSERVQFVRRLRTDSTGYVLTHEAIALTIMFKSGCLEGKRTESELKILISRLFSQFMANQRPYHDLALEQAAALCFAGFCSVIPDAYIDGMLSAQSFKGSWAKDEKLGETAFVTKEHATALGLYVLACHLHCPER